MRKKQHVFWTIDPSEKKSQKSIGKKSRFVDHDSWKKCHVFFSFSRP
jgi:hypothetical protein